MKKIFIIAVMLIGMAGYSQTSSKSYKYTKVTERYKGSWQVYDLDRQETDSTAAPDVWRTSDVAIYHGDKHPVYLSKSGKLFIWVTSSSGNTYRKYIK